MLLCVAGTALTARAQKVTLNFRNAKLEQVFGRITEQTGYTFYYARPTVNPDKVVSIAVAEVDVRAALIQLLADDKVEIEPFDVHPGAFLGWILTDGKKMIAAIVLFFFGMSAIALALCALSLIFAIVEFLLYKQLLDPFFAKKTSHNVVAVRKPKGEVKRRIIFSGHADSANEWRFTYYGGSKLLVPIIGLSFVGILLGLVLGIWAVAAGHAFSAADSGALNVMRYVFLAWIPILFTALFFENKKRPVMGANDALTGCFISLAGE